MKVAAVIVTYHPPREFASNVIRVLLQVERVYIVDNGSDPSCFDFLNSLDRVTIIFNTKNLGLGAAQNAGVRAAIEDGYEWILFLDQDSFLTPRFIQTMISYFQSLEDNERALVFILGPKIYDQGGGFFYRYLQRSGKFGFRRVECDGEGIKDIIFVISSGSLIPAGMFQKLGFFREDFFIDYIDNEFCLRGITRGFRIHIVCGAVLIHRIGDRRLKRIGMVELKPTFHSHLRRYTIYRNRVKVWRLYYKKVASYVVFDVMAMLYDLFRILLAEDDKRKKLLSAVKGFWHGWKEPVSESF